MIDSQICTLSSLESPELLAWSEVLRPLWDPDGTDGKPFVMHRKMWEWLFICAVLSERGVLAPGRRGLGFGVGQEPLVAVFANLGVEIVATDLPPDLAIERGWTTSGREYSDSIDALNNVGLCPDDAFQRLVTFRPVDMVAIPAELRGFDFNWSSCAFEHLGSLEAGLKFLVEQMRCIRPGGFAVHTTEYNVSSNEETVNRGGTVLYRRRDVEAVILHLRREGYQVQCDFTLGDTPSDRHVDVAPFSDVHLRTRLGEFATTSLGLVIHKPDDWQPQRPDRAAGGQVSRMRRLAGALRPGRAGGPPTSPGRSATSSPDAEPL